MVIATVVPTGATRGPVAVMTAAVVVVMVVVVVVVVEVAVPSGVVAAIIVVAAAGGSGGGGGGGAKARVPRIVPFAALPAVGRAVRHAEVVQWRIKGEQRG